MIDYMFDDYLNLYKKMNSVEWVVLYEENEIKNYENDIFTFCVMKESESVYNDGFMEKYDWGFAVENFGKSTFYSNGPSDEANIIFNSGEYYKDNEYLIALRRFDKYETSIEINPKLIWYGNLININGSYVDPITDEQIIRVMKSKIEVRREYLKDFLSANNMVCMIVFDHRRYFNKTENIKHGYYKNISDKNYFMNLSITNTRSYGPISSQYDSCSCIIGKTLVLPFKKPQHEDYKYLADKKQYETFVIGYLEEEDKTLEYTCQESVLANYFGANADLPHFLTPVYFDIKILDKYQHDPRNYEISDSSISFLKHWSIPFNINEEKKVVVWLGDLGRLPHKEQKYWKAFNETPKGGIENKFFQRQIMGIWTDESRIESKLISSIDRFNLYINEKCGDTIFNRLSEADHEIYSTFMIPTNSSVPEYQSFLMKLSKLTAESINVKLIKKVMGDSYDSEIGGSVLQLGEFLKHMKIDMNGAISGSIKKVYDSRNKLAGHRASFGEYNKVWGRDKDYKFDTIGDAEQLLENIIGALEYSIAESNSSE